MKSIQVRAVSVGVSLLLSFYLAKGKMAFGNIDRYLNALRACAQRRRVSKRSRIAIYLDFLLLSLQKAEEIKTFLNELA